MVNGYQDNRVDHHFPYGKGYRWGRPHKNLLTSPHCGDPSRMGIATSSWQGVFSFWETPSFPVGL